MNLALIAGIAIVWMFLSAVVVVCASMMSSQISKAEELGKNRQPRTRPLPSFEAQESGRIPTQPRPGIAN